MSLLSLVQTWQQRQQQQICSGVIGSCLATLRHKLQRRTHGTCGDVVVTWRSGCDGPTHLREFVRLLTLASRCDSSVLRALLSSPPEAACPYLPCAWCDDGDRRMTITMCVREAQHARVIADTLFPQTDIEDVQPASSQFLALRSLFLRRQQLTRVAIGIRLVITQIVFDDYDMVLDLVRRVGNANGIAYGHEESDLSIQSIVIKTFNKNGEMKLMKAVFEQSTVPVIVKCYPSLGALVAASRQFLSPSLRHVVSLSFHVRDILENEEILDTFERLLTGCTQLRALSIYGPSRRQLVPHTSRNGMRMLGKVLFSKCSPIRLQRLELFPVGPKEVEYFREGASQLETTSNEVRWELRDVAMYSLDLVPLLPATIERLEVEHTQSLNELDQMLTRFRHLRAVSISTKKGDTTRSVYSSSFVVEWECVGVASAKDSGPIPLGDNADLTALCYLVRRLGPFIRLVDWYSEEDHSKHLISLLIKNCPQLEELRLNDADEHGIDAIAQAHADGRWRLRCLRLSKSNAIHPIACIRLLWYLSDPLHSLTRCLTKLVVLVDDLGCFRDIQASIVQMLLTNYCLQLVIVQEEEYLGCQPEDRCNVMLAEAQRLSSDSRMCTLAEDIAVRGRAASLPDFVRDPTFTVALPSLRRRLALLSVLRAHHSGPHWLASIPEIGGLIVEMAGRASFRLHAIPYVSYER